MKKLSKKHIYIFKRIQEKGKYKPAYSDQEPAMRTLLREGLVEWNATYSGVILTEKGKQFVSERGEINS